ncbi:MAG: RnfH family protein [Pseudomonadales bacterium]|nr:RnfH family protein [Pseudomonadales bacterium]
MKVSVVYAGQPPVLVSCQLEEGSPVRDAIERSGIKFRCPSLDLSTAKVGIFGKLVKMDRPLQEGDRVEIYRKITRVLDEDDDDD